MSTCNTTLPGDYCRALLRRGETIDPSRNAASRRAVVSLLFGSLGTATDPMEWLEFDLRFRRFDRIGSLTRCGIIRPSPRTAIGCRTVRSQPTIGGLQRLVQAAL